MGFKETQVVWRTHPHVEGDIRSGSISGSLPNVSAVTRKTALNAIDSPFNALEAQLNQVIETTQQSRATREDSVTAATLSLKATEQWVDFIACDEGEASPYPLPASFNETAAKNDPLPDDLARAQVHAGYVTVFNQRWNALFGSTIKLVSPEDYERFTETGVFRHKLDLVPNANNTLGEPRRAKVRLRTVASLFPSRDSANRFEKRLMFALSQGQNHVEHVMLGTNARTFLARIEVTPHSTNRPLEMDATWQITDLSAELGQSSVATSSAAPASVLAQPDAPPTALVQPTANNTANTSDRHVTPPTIALQPVQTSRKVRTALQDQIQEDHAEMAFEFSCDELFDSTDDALISTLDEAEVPVLTQTLPTVDASTIESSPSLQAGHDAIELPLNPLSRFNNGHRIDEALWDKLIALSAKGTAAEALDYLKLAVEGFALASASFWRLSKDQSFFEREFVVQQGHASLIQIDVRTAEDLTENAFPNTPAYFDALQNNHVVTSNLVATPQMMLPLLADELPGNRAASTVGHATTTPHSQQSPSPLYSQQIDVPVMEHNKVIGMLRFITGSHGLHCEGETLRFLRQCSLHASERILTLTLHTTNLQLTQLAFFDDVTGLGNQRWFEAELTSLLDHIEPVSSDAPMQRVFICLAEVDQFRDICDQFGQKVGNHILRTTGQIIKSYIDTHKLSQQVLVARVHTDQFAFVIRGTNSQHAQQLIHALLHHLGVRSPSPDFYQRVTACVGFTAFPEHGHTAEQLLQRAEFALYQAKQNGRSTIHSFTHDLQKRAERRTAINQDLFKALDHQQLMVFYQPQVELATKRVIGLEALIRWQHPVFGLVLPGAFLELAEEHELIERISDFVLQTTCQSAAKWRDAGLYDGPVSVNISGRHFRNKQLPSIITSALLKSRLAAQRLTIEITETSVVDDRPETQQVLRALSNLGVNLAIDDFGVGYSSLNYLKRLSVEHIKIDKSFIEGLPHDEDNLAIVTAIMTMAKRFKLNVIAEGVENEAQAECLKNLGCFAAQGFFYSPPISHEELETLFLHGAIPPID